MSLLSIRRLSSGGVITSYHCVSRFGVYPGQDARQILASSPPSCAQALSDTSHFH